MQLTLTKLAYALCTAGLLSISAGSIAQAQDAPQPSAQEPPAPAQEAPSNDAAANRAAAQERAKTTQAFNKLWRPVGSKVISYEGRFLSCIKFDSKFPNSNHATAAQWLKENEDNEDKMMSPPREEADAFAEHLPKIAPGEYGKVESFKVEKNLGSNEFVVSAVWIIDPDKYKEQLDKANMRRTHSTGGIASSSGHSLSMTPEAAKAYNDRLRKSQRSIRDGLTQIQDTNIGVQLRLLAFPLEKPVVNERVSSSPGKQPLTLAIVGVDTEPVEGITTATRYLAIPVMRFRTGLNEAQFKAYLTAAGYSVEDFVKLAEEAQKADEKGWANAVAEQVYTAYIEKNPFTSKRR